MGGWSPATTLAVYRLENVLGSLLVAAWIALHRRFTGKRGHHQARPSRALAGGLGCGIRRVVVGASRARPRETAPPRLVRFRGRAIRPYS